MIAIATGDGFHRKLNKVEAILNIRILKSYPKKVKCLKMKTQLIQLKSISEFYSC